MTPLVVILPYLGEGEQYPISDEPVRVALCSAQAHVGVGLPSLFTVNSSRKDVHLTPYALHKAVSLPNRHLQHP